MSLVLASTSRYRREMLERLGLPFDCARPDVDETPMNGEAPLALATRLAAAKAAEVASRHPGAGVDRCLLNIYQPPRRAPMGVWGGGGLKKKGGGGGGGG
ncbi:Maf family protein, partial [Stenotrophomonas geniculata]